MWKKFKLEGKLPDKSKLLIMLLVGLLILVIAMPTSEKNISDVKEKEQTIEIYDSYELKLETRLEQALAEVEGVGEVKVMITLKNDGVRVVEKDLQMDTQNLQEEDSAGGTRTTKDQSTTNASVYEQATNGEQIPYVSQEIMPEVEGVIVIAQGGDDSVVIRDITEAVQALFHLDAHKIKIMKRIDS